MKFSPYLAAILRYSTPVSRWVLAVVLLAITGTLLEFIALSLLVPLTQTINHSTPGIVTRTWTELLGAIHVTPDIRTWFELFVALLIRVLMQRSFAARVACTSSVASA